MQNVSNSRHIKKELTWLWTSSHATSTSPSTPGCAGTGNPRGPLALLAVPPAAHFLAVFLAIDKRRRGNMKSRVGKGRCKSARCRSCTG